MKSQWCRSWSLTREVWLKLSLCGWWRVFELFFLHFFSTWNGIWCVMITFSDSLSQFWRTLYLVSGSTQKKLAPVKMRKITIYLSENSGKKTISFSQVPSLVEFVPCSLYVYKRNQTKRTKKLRIKKGRYCSAEVPFDFHCFAA